MRSTLRSILVAVAACTLVVGGTALAAVYRDFSEFRLIRHTNLRGPSSYVASADINKAVLQQYQFFKVDASAGDVDLDFGNDAALDAADIGSEWVFCIGIANTGALTITAGASGVTTMKAIALKGTTCEDVGDCISVIAYSTTQASAVTSCND